MNTREWVKFMIVLVVVAIAALSFMNTIKKDPTKPPALSADNASIQEIERINEEAARRAEEEQWKQMTDGKPG